MLSYKKIIILQRLKSRKIDVREQNQRLKSRKNNGMYQDQRLNDKRIN